MASSHKDPQINSAAEGWRSLLLENALDAVIGIDHDGTIVDWNRRAEITFGWAKDEALGRPLAELIIPDDQRKAHHQGMSRYLNTGVGHLLNTRFETTAVHRSGCSLPIELTIIPVRTNGSQLFYSFARDISDRKRAEAQRIELAEKELAAREKMLMAQSQISAFFDQAMVGIAITDLSGRFTLANQRYCELLGKSLEELQKLSVQDVTHPEDFKRNIPLLEELTTKGRSFTIEKRYICSDGTQIWVNNSCSLFRDAQGNAAGIIAVSQDLTDRNLAEQAARQSNDQFRLMVESVKDYAIFMLDAKGYVLTWNEGAERIKGYKAKEIIGKHFSVFYPKDVVESQFPEYELKVASEIGRFEDEGWRIRKDGSRIWADVVITALRNSKGELVGFAKVTRDLSERKKAEEQIRIFAAMANNSPDFIGICDLEKRVTFVNPEGLKMAGRDNYQGTYTSDYFNDEDNERIDREVIPSIFHKGSWQGEIKIHNHKTGRGTFVSMKAFPILDPSTGQPIALANVSRDITERKQSEERALLLAETSSSFSESLDYEATLDKITHWAVPQICDLCSVKILREDGNVHRLAVSFSDPEKEKKIQDLIAKISPDIELPLGSAHVFSTGKPHLIEELSEPRLQALVKQFPELRQLRDTIDPLSLMSVPLKTTGGRVLGAITFVTSRESGRRYKPNDLEFMEEFSRRCGLAIENAELFRKLEGAVRTRDEFISIASHELKTPLTTLHLQNQIAQRQLQKGKAESFDLEWVASTTAQTDKQLRQLNRLVEDMLDISRISLGRLQFSFEKTDLGLIVRSTLERLHPQLSESGSIFTLHAVPELKGMCDSFRIEQVLVNLLTNAAKYGAGKPVDIHLFEEGGYAVIKVQDRGIGIAPEYQTRVFDRFERAISANQISGFGLGLFITRQIVEAHDGTIEVNSRLGEGSTFIVRLPIQGPDL